MNINIKKSKKNIDKDFFAKKINIGVIVEGDSIKQIEEAYKKLQILLQDPDLSTRCFNTANLLFSLDKGIEMYHQIYETIPKSNNRSCVD